MQILALSVSQTLLLSSQKIPLWRRLDSSRPLRQSFPPT
jgi:hypothetical protein